MGLALPKGSWPDWSVPVLYFPGKASVVWLLSTFSSSSAQHISRALPYTQASTNHFARKEVGVQFTSLCCWFPAEHCLLGLLQKDPATPSPFLPWVGPVQHTLNNFPSNGLVQSSPTASLTPPCSALAQLPCFIIPKLPPSLFSSLSHFFLPFPLSSSLSLSLQMALKQPWECIAAPIMSPWFLVSCTLSRKVTRPDNIIYIAV